MSISYNQNAKEQLGCAYSTARSKLYKNIVFGLIQECEKNYCCRCGKEIVNINDFSVDHKIEWLHKPNARELYFDAKNISFSHISCNSSFARCKHVVKNNTGYKGVTFCSDRKRNKPYRVAIKQNNINKVIGYYASPIDAAKAYDKAALIWFEKRAVTNEMLGLL